MKMFVFVFPFNEDSYASDSYDTSFGKVVFVSDNFVSSCDENSFGYDSFVSPSDENIFFGDMVVTLSVENTSFSNSFILSLQWFVTVSYFLLWQLCSVSPVISDGILLFSVTTMYSL